MLKSRENWFGFIKICVYNGRQTREIYQVLPYKVDFKAFGQFWNQLNKTVLDACSFIWNEGPVNIWNVNLKTNLYVVRFSDL